MEQEEWRDVIGFENWYQVSNLGSVRSVDRVIKCSDGKIKLYKGIVLSCVDIGNGYKSVGLFKNQIKKSMQIHRLVAEAFLPNPMNKPQVNHIDFNPSNNKLSNLEWCTGKENVRHSIENNKNWSIINAGILSRKKVCMIDKNNIVVDMFDSMSDASIKTGVCICGISLVCRGKRKSAGKYIWQFC